MAARSSSEATNTIGKQTGSGDIEREVQKGQFGEVDVRLISRLMAGGRGELLGSSAGPLSRWKRKRRGLTGHDSSTLWIRAK
jgi:hypothetical protein